jgi:hypothetical protein
MAGQVAAPRAVKPQTLGLVRIAVAPWATALATVGAAARLDRAAPQLSELLGLDTPRGFPAEGAPLRVWAGAAVLAYVALLVVSRASAVGLYYHCEILWGCNTALVMAGWGLVRGLPLLVGTAVCIVGLDQLAWYVDCLGWLVLRKWPIGVAKYLSAPTTSRVHFATSFHHLWFLPLCLASLHGVGMPPLSYVASVALTSGLALAARLLTPFAVDEGKHIKVLNVNMSYAFWADVKIPGVHAFDHRHPALYLPYLIVVCNLYLNTLPVLVLYALANALR